MDETNAPRGTTRKRRHPGDGGIYQRRGDGLWVGTVEAGYEGNKRGRKVVYGKTRAIALKKQREAQKQVDSGVSVTDKRITVAAYLDWWATTVLPGTVKDSTADGYRWSSTTTSFPTSADCA